MGQAEQDPGLPRSASNVLGKEILLRNSKSKKLPHKTGHAFPCKEKSNEEGVHAFCTILFLEVYVKKKKKKKKNPYLPYLFFGGM